MEKYIDADLLRKEIEFAKTVYDNPNSVVHGVADAFRQDGRAAMCDDILKIIASLQQEQPDVDLEKEIEEHSERMPMSEFTIDSEAEEFVKWAKQEFRHFYELGFKAGK